MTPDVRAEVVAGRAWSRWTAAVVAVLVAAGVLAAFTNSAYAGTSGQDPPRVGDLCSSDGETRCWWVRPRSDAVAFSVQASAPTGHHQVTYRIRNDLDKLQSTGTMVNGEHRALSMRAGDVLSITGAGGHVVHLTVMAVQDKEGSGDEPSGQRPVDPRSPQLPVAGDVCARSATTTCWRVPEDHPAPGVAFSVVASGGDVSQRARFRTTNSRDGMSADGDIFFTAHQALSLRPGDTLSLTEQQDNPAATLTVVAVQPFEPQPIWFPVGQGNPSPPRQYDVCRRDDVEPIAGKSCWKVPANDKPVAFSAFAAGGRAGHELVVDIYNDLDHLSELQHLAYGGPHQALVMRPGDRLIIRGTNDRDGGLYIAAVQP